MSNNVLMNDGRWTYTMGASVNSNKFGKKKKKKKWRRKWKNFKNNSLGILKTCIKMIFILIFFFVNIKRISNRELVVTCRKLHHSSPRKGRLKYHRVFDGGGGDRCCIFFYRDITRILSRILSRKRLSENDAKTRQKKNDKKKKMVPRYVLSRAIIE